MNRPITPLLGESGRQPEGSGIVDGVDQDRYLRAPTGRGRRSGAWSASAPSLSARGRPAGPTERPRGPSAPVATSWLPARDPGDDVVIERGDRRSGHPSPRRPGRLIDDRVDAGSTGSPEVGLISTLTSPSASSRQSQGLEPGWGRAPRPRRSARGRSWSRRPEAPEPHRRPRLARGRHEPGAGVERADLSAIVKSPTRNPRIAPRVPLEPSGRRRSSSTATRRGGRPGTPSPVSRTSSSQPSAPASNPRRAASSVFSGASDTSRPGGPGSGGGPAATDTTPGTDSRSTGPPIARETPGLPLLAR